MQLCSTRANVLNTGFNEIALPTAGGTPQGIMAGLDNATWFTDASSDKIGRIISTGGDIGEFGQYRVSNSSSGPVTGLTKLSVGVDGDLWGFGNQTAYHHDRLLNQWDATAGVFSQISVGNGTSVWAVAPDDSIYQWNPQTQSWDQIPGALTQIAVGANGQVAGVNSSNQAYGLFGPTHRYKSLYQVPGSLSQVSVGVDGTAWGVDSVNRIYHFDPGTQTWQNIPGELVQVAVGAVGTVWASTRSNRFITTAQDTLVDVCSRFAGSDLGRERKQHLGCDPDATTQSWGHGRVFFLRRWLK